MVTKVEILTPLQKELMGHLFSDPWFRRHFYLTGGTALSAFYLFHRLSDDLDFFSHDVELTPIPGLILDVSKKMRKTSEIVQTSPGFMRFLIAGELKVDVVGDVGFRVGSPELVDDLMVDSLKNIAINKVCCLLSRLDPKDYVDLYFIFLEKDFDIFELLELGEKKDKGLDPFVWASLIADVEPLAVMPRMIRPVTPSELQEFFLKLKDKILDRIRPKKR